MDLKNKLETTTKNHQASIQNLEAKLDRLADKQSGRPSGSLPSNTQPNPKGSSSKPYQPPQARNEHVNVVFTRSGKSYDPPDNLNDQQNDSETPINFDSDDEDEEPKPKNSKPVKETSIPKPYKPKIPYPQRLRKEKTEAQYGKFLDMIRAVRINVPLVDVLARMPNYGEFLKELVNNKHKIEQILATFLSDKSSAILQNKVPPKLGDLGSFLIPCNFNKAFSCSALADLSASINLMSYSLYTKLSLETLKTTQMSVRLTNRSFQYPVGIDENLLVEVGKFTFPADFVILEMEEDNKFPLILGRHFLHTTDAVIRVKQKQFNLRVRTERMIFHIDSAMKHSYSINDTCFSIDVIDEILEEDFDALLDKGSKILYSIEGTILEEKLFAEFDEFMAMTADENFESESDTKEPPFEKITFNTNYKIKTSLEEPPTDLELKPLTNNLEYVFLEEPSFLRRCKDAHLVLNWEKCHFMVKEVIVLLHKVSEAGLKVDKAKIEVISKLQPPLISKAEAQALPTNDARVVINFLKKPFCRFGMPKALISDRGTHFYNKIMENTMNRYEVNHRFSTSYHPQTSGQFENTNKALKRNLENTVKDNPAIWSRKLDDALWAFRTAYKTPTGTTPYKLVYGKNCHLPFKIKHRAYWSLKNYNPDLIAAGKKRMFQLHELDKLRHQAYENSRLYKARTKVWHDRKLKMRKEFKHGNKVLHFHSKYKFKQPKLRSRWLGLYIVKHQYASGYVKLYGKDGKTFIVNGHRLTLYHEEEDYNDQKEAVTPYFPKE
ncbi:reverse transcriptase domain-containing protein [Tanacetum coccineum]